MEMMELLLKPKWDDSMILHSCLCVLNIIVTRLISYKMFDLLDTVSIYYKHNKIYILSDSYPSVHS